MTFLINAGSNQLTLGSDVIDELVADPTGQLLLTVYPTCESVGVEIEIETADLTAGDYVLLASALGVETFDEGAYRFVFKYTKSPDVVTESALYFIWNDILCNIIKYYAAQNIDCLEKSVCHDNLVLWPYIHFDLLKSVHLCSNVCHAEACSMWGMLSDLVGKEAKCGC
jgi:hypothetical protein